MPKEIVMMHSHGTVAQKAGASVKVVLNIRPLLGEEKASQCKEFLRVVAGKSQVQLPNGQAFTFDQVYGTSARPLPSLFDDYVLPLVEGLFQGYNATVLAYGQTGSGKSYTMGTTENPIGHRHPGVIARVMEAICERAKTMKEKAEIHLGVSFIEVHMDDIKDLLDAPSSSKGAISSHSDSVSGSLALRETTEGDIHLAGVTERRVKSHKEMAACLQEGSLCRSTASTSMNSQSSRSHAIITISVRQRQRFRAANVETEETNGNEDRNLRAKIHLVDLAGCERAKRTKTGGHRFQEGVHINKGLLALGNVISALGEDRKRGESVHIPYRDSKLTRLLQDSLGGNSRTVMIACVSPTEVNMQETLGTLQYANRARNIQNTPVVNTEAIGGDPAVSRLRQQVQMLEAELAACRSKSFVADSPVEHCSSEGKVRSPLRALSTNTSLFSIQPENSFSESVRSPLGSHSTDTTLFANPRARPEPGLQLQDDADSGHVSKEEDEQSRQELATMLGAALKVTGLKKQVRQLTMKLAAVESERSLLAQELESKKKNEQPSPSSEDVYGAIVSHLSGKYQIANSFDGGGTGILAEELEKMRRCVQDIHEKIERCDAGLRLEGSKSGEMLQGREEEEVSSSSLKEPQQLAVEMWKGGHRIRDLPGGIGAVIFRLCEEKEELLREHRKERETFLRERDDLLCERDEAVLQRGAAIAERDKAVQKQEHIMLEKDRALWEEERTHIEEARDGMARERNELALALAKVTLERDEAVLRRDEAIAKKDKVVQERDSIVFERDRALEEIDVFVKKMDEATLTMDKVISERDKVVCERDQALLQRDEALGDRDKVVQKQQATVLERDRALQERESLVKKVEEAIVERVDVATERDSVVLERNELVLALKKVLSERDEAVLHRGEAIAEKEKVMQQHKGIVLERDRALQEAVALAKKIDEEIIERFETESERDKAIQERDSIILERDELVLAIDKVILERDELTLLKEKAELDGRQAARERDEVILERDELACERDKIILERDEMARERDEALRQRDVESLSKEKAAGEKIAKLEKERVRLEGQVEVLNMAVKAAEEKCALGTTRNESCPDDWKQELVKLRDQLEGLESAEVGQLVLSTELEKASECKMTNAQHVRCKSLSVLDSLPVPEKSLQEELKKTKEQYKLLKQVNIEMACKLQEALQTKSALRTTASILIESRNAAQEKLSAIENDAASHSRNAKVFAALTFGFAQERLELMNEREALLEEIDELAHELDELSTERDDMVERLTTLEVGNEKLAGLEAANKKLEVELADLRERYEESERHQKEMEDEVMSSERMMVEMVRQHSELEAQLFNEQQRSNKARRELELCLRKKLAHIERDIRDKERKLNASKRYLSDDECSGRRS